MTILLVSAHCFSQSVATSNTEMNGIKFGTCSYEFSSNEFSKKIDFTLPLPSENAVLQTISEALLMGEYDNSTLEQDLKNELSSYISDKKEDAVKADDYNETSWCITPVFVGGGYIAFVSSCAQKFASEVAPAPMWGDKCAVFSLTTGKRISEDEIFDKVGEHNYIVARKLYSSLCKILKKEDDGDNVDVSFLFNDNFYFTAKELIYKYGSFEMYHTSGVTELSIPKKCLKPYLNVDGPLYKYWFGEKK
ncbi:MAG: hypothetical protein II394_08520 [Bacteroidales bacterium]|nr:hypothetical protein [Bacteroidales bacterium]